MPAHSAVDYPLTLPRWNDDQITLLYIDHCAIFQAQGGGPVQQITFFRCVKAQDASTDAILPGWPAMNSQLAQARAGNLLFKHDRIIHFARLSFSIRM
jgi:hypothetical protein